MEGTSSWILAYDKSKEESILPLFQILTAVGFSQYNDAISHGAWRLTKWNGANAENPFEVMAMVNSRLDVDGPGIPAQG